jgi:hypothetical protein
MQYKLWGPYFTFKFTGHGLEAGQKYSLIYYPDSWPGQGLICLGSAYASDLGIVRVAKRDTNGFKGLMKRVEINSNLPLDSDANASCGAKIWLVLADDVDCENEMMIGWTPTEYLFEHTLIRYIDTDE